MHGKAKARQTNSVGGFSLAELMVALAVTSLVMGGLTVTAISLGKSFKATELYSKSNSAQIRLIDAMAMDLRRAVSISITTSSDSNPSSTSNTSTRFAYSSSDPTQNTKTIRDGTFDPIALRSGVASAPSTYLTLQIPGYYKSNSIATANYRLETMLTSTGRTVCYGNPAGSGVAPPVTVQYREGYLSKYGSQCYIRREAGVDTVIAAQAELMDLDITAKSDGSFVVDSWFTPTFSNRRHLTDARVTSSDRVMLRNPRID
jgi:Tfp pilus assembly protein FimT